MERLAVLAPPVITPSEVPAGAFMLAGGLAARGIEAPIHDLSLGFFRWLFLNYAPKAGLANCSPALEYLISPKTAFYSPHKHRSVCGVLQSVIKKYKAHFPGWQLSLMDSVPPGITHSTDQLLDIAKSGKTPFTEYFSTWINKHSSTIDHALISVAYLSQLPAAVELSWMLEEAGVKVTVGGSLASALKHTGSGIELLKKCFRNLALDDGRSLVNEDTPFLTKIEWPVFAESWKYFSSRPVIPFPLTTGCTWNKCLFCPDRDKPLSFSPAKNLEKILKKAPDNSVIHFIDSAIPSEGIIQALPILRQKSYSFYGFARPEGRWLKDNLLSKMADSGCLMLQTGAESGSEDILRRFTKGFSPKTAESVISAIAKTGIRNYVYLLFGLPGETDIDRNLTLQMVERLKGKIDYMNLSIFNLPTKSELTDRAEEYGIIPGEYDSDTDVLRFYRPFECIDGSNPRLEARQFLNNQFKTNSIVNSVLQGTPKWFRAGHMALMEKSK